MEKIPRDIIDLVLESTDILEVVSLHVRLKGSGKGNQMGLCPFHEEKTPSFNVSPQKRIFKCFGCGIGGDAIKFLMLIENKSFGQVVRELADRLNIEIPSEGRGAYASLLEMHRLASYFFRRELLKSREASDYLKSRGLSDEVSEEFGIGYAPDSWDSLLQEIRRHLGKLESELLIESGLFKEGKTEGSVYDAFRGRLMFPIRNRKGDVVAFGGRIIQEESRGPKYINSPESRIFDKGHLLYNLHSTSKQQNSELMVVEGYMDVAALAQYGFPNAVAPLGTGFTPHHASLLEQESKKVVLVFDGDRAGSQATLRALERLVDSGLEVRALRLHEGMDPQDFLNTHGRDAFSRLIDSAPPVLRFFCEEVIGENPLDTRQSKKKAYLTIRDFFHKVNQVLLVGEDTNESELLRYLGQQFQLDEAIIRREFLPARAAGHMVPRESPSIPEAYVDLGMKLMVWAYPSAKLREMLLPHLLEKELETELLRELYGFLKIESKIPLFNRLAEMSKELSDYLSGLHWVNEKMEIEEGDFHDYLKNFKVLSLQRELNQLCEDISHCKDLKIRKELESLRKKALEMRKKWLRGNV